MEKFLKGLKITTVFTICFVVYSIHHDIEENKAFQRQLTMYECDGYAYDQDIAPAHCK